MKEDIQSLVFDAGAIIELLMLSDNGVKLRDLLIDEKIEAHTTELAMTETMYILCRKYGFEESRSRVNKLLDSGYITLWETSQLVEDAAKIKCEHCPAGLFCHSPCRETQV